MQRRGSWCKSSKFMDVDLCDPSERDWERGPGIKGNSTYSYHNTSNFTFVLSVTGVLRYCWSTTTVVRSASVQRTEKRWSDRCEVGSTSVQVLRILHLSSRAIRIPVLTTVVFLLYSGLYPPSSFTTTGQDIRQTWSPIPFTRLVTWV
jgi:hypothetical protein